MQVTHKLPFGIRVKRKGLRRSFFRDLYHMSLRASWLEFLATAFVLYMIANAFFAYLYYIGGNSIVNATPYSYWEAFIFSFQTSSTIGYGHYLPATGYANAVTILDAMSGIFFVALITGLAIAKFSRPTAHVMFSENVIINRYNGKLTLMFRVANARASHIVDATLKATILKNEVSSEGQQMRRLLDLDLVRNNSPMFFLSWLVMHEINEDSPIFGMSAEDLKADKVAIILSLTGIDDWSAQMVHANYFYRYDDIKFDKQFADIIQTNPDDSLEIDYGQFQVLKDV